MHIDVGRENSTVIGLHVEDLGFGRPVLLVHGWPNSSRVWEPQVPALLDAGHRVLCCDRRGFGRSSRCSTGFDVDTLADDLRQVLDALDLRDGVLVGYGLGCAEVLRFLGTFGADRLRGAVLVAPLPPVLPTVLDGDGLDEDSLTELRAALSAQRHGFLARFVDDVFAPEGLPVTHRLDAAARQALWMDAVGAGAMATRESLQALGGDFRDDLPRIGVPTLVLHGGADRLMPAAAQVVAAGIAGARLERIDGAPHGLLWTHADAVNAALLRFLG